MREADARTRGLVHRKSALEVRTCLVGATTRRSCEAEESVQRTESALRIADGVSTRIRGEEGQRTCSDLGVTDQCARLDHDGKDEKPFVVDGDRAEVIGRQGIEQRTRLRLPAEDGVQQGT